MRRGMWSFPIGSIDLQIYWNMVYINIFFLLFFDTSCMALFTAVRFCLMHNV